jgi:hypothetical protein
MLPAQGAVPVYKNGERVGALGGSGATAQQDEEWPKLAGPRSQPIHMRFGDSTSGTCWDMSLQAALWVPSLYGPL